MPLPLPFENFSLSDSDLPVLSVEIGPFHADVSVRSCTSYRHY